VSAADIAKLLWDAANAITSFSVVQALIFTYACAKKETADLLNRKLLKAAIAAMIVAITAMECVAIEWCRRHLCTLDAEHCALHAEATSGRLFLVVCTAVFSIVILYARQLFSKKPFAG